MSVLYVESSGFPDLPESKSSPWFIEPALWGPFPTPPTTCVLYATSLGAQAAPTTRALLLLRAAKHTPAPGPLRSVFPLLSVLFPHASTLPPTAGSVGLS